MHQTLSTHSTTVLSLAASARDWTREHHQRATQHTLLASGAEIRYAARLPKINFTPTTHNKSETRAF